MDFPLILVLATFVSGALWAGDALFWAPRRQRGGGEQEAGQDAQQPVKEPVIVEYARAFFPIFLVVLLVRSFLVEPFRIPSGSMMPTLLVGDLILVNKFSYGLRLPVLHNKFLDLDEPQRGDVVVFRYPEDPDKDYIKRVIGVPGDHIVYRSKTLYVNGEKMEQKNAGAYIGAGGGAAMTGASLRSERLDGVEHAILVLPNVYDRDFEFRVPDAEYFVMGDNRDNSRDSRYWGTVPEENLLGKAFMIWMNWDSDAGGVAWQRIGTLIE